MRTWRTIFILICVTCMAHAQQSPPESRPLSLEECITIALEHNFDIQIQRYNPRIASLALYGAYGAYDPVFSFSGEHDYNLSPGGVDAQGRSFSGTESDTDRFSTGLQGLLPWGMSYNLGGNISDQTGSKPSSRFGTNIVSYTTNTFYDVNNPSNSINFITANFNSIPTRSPFESTSGSAGALTLRQPLLKNFWIDSTRYTIFLDKKELQRSDADLRDQIMATVTATEEAYFNLIYAQENVKVQEKALELASQLLAENKKRVEVGALAPLDEKQAAAQEASSRADLLKARAAESTQQRVLKSLLSDNYTNEWADVVVLPTDKLIALPQTYDLQESWRKGLASGGSREKLQQLRLSLEEDIQGVRLQRNQLFPQLDLIGSYGFNGSGREFSDALDQIRRQDNPSWTAGAQLTIPLAQISARNSLKAAKASRERAALRVRQGEQNTLIQIENDIATAQSDFEQVDATREARLYAEAALEAEQKKFESGKSTSFIVLQLQKNLTDARSAEILALAQYNNSLAELAFDEGNTLQRHKITIATK